jgi:hypothetical protein
VQITIRGYRRRRWSVVGWLTVAAILAGCSSSTPAGPIRSSISFSTEPPSSTSTAATDSGATAPSPVQTAATFTASDDSGNTASMVISLGTIQPASQITDPVVQACAADISQLSSSLDHTMAVPVAIRIQLTSSLSSDIVVNLVNQYLAVKGDSPEAASNEEPFLLAEGYAAGPACAIPDAINGRIQWQNAPPGAPQTWHGYILQANAITPNDPTGAASAIHRLLLDPMVTLGASLAKVNYLPASSPFEVLCQYPMGGGGGRPLLAIVPSWVLNYGCSPA